MFVFSYSKYTRGVMKASLDYATNRKPRLMTTEEVSNYLRISPASVYRLVKEQKIPVSRIGKHLRFRKDVIDEWLTQMENENHKIPPNQ